MLQEVHHESFHAAKSPGSFIEGKADLEDAKAVGEAIDSGLGVFEEPGIGWVGQFVAFQRGTRQDLTLDVADVFVDRSVPCDAEDVPMAIVAERFEEANVLAQFHEVVVEGGPQCRRSRNGRAASPWLQG